MPDLAQRRLNRSPLRVRLTLWYVLLMGLTALLFSGYLYLQLQRSLMASIDVSLQVAATQSLASLDDENTRPAFQDTENTLVAARSLDQAGFALRLLAPDGSVWDGFGAYMALPVWIPTSAGYVTQPGNDLRWRVYSQPIQTPDGRVAGWLQAAQSLTDVDETLANMRIQLLLGLPLVLFLAGLGGLFLADRALRPIDRITRTAQTISASDLSRRIGYRGASDEVGRLASTFDQMLNRLQAAFERERRFTADAAHELRTPLTALKGQLDVTLSRPRSRTEYADTLQNLAQQVNRLIRLSNALLFLSRSDQGRLSWEPILLNVSDLLAATVEQVQPLAEAKGLTLITEIPPEIPITGDVDHLIRLFLNLLDNAVKYTPPGERVSVEASCDETYVRIAIGDTGPGIPPEHLSRLFERFYRVEADRSRQTGGTGLGLAIAREIARLHQGSIEVKSEPDQGTTFTVRLPVRQPGHQGRTNADVFQQ